MRLASLWLSLWLIACTTTAPDEAPATLPVSLLAIPAQLILPSTTLTLRGDGFLKGADYQATLTGSVAGQSVSLALVVTYQSPTELAAVFPVEAVLRAPEGNLLGELTLTVRTPDEVSGEARLDVGLQLAHDLTPQITAVPAEAWPATALTLAGAGFIGGSEGETLIELSGTFESDAGETRLLQAEAAVVPSEDARRDAALLVFDPRWVGLGPGTVTGRLRPKNQGASFDADGAWVSFSLRLRPPRVTRFDAVGGRGRAVGFFGQGFVGASFGGHTELELTGRLDDQPLPDGGVILIPEWLDGTHLRYVMRTTFYGGACESGDLGARAGTLRGSLTPIITLGDQVVRGESRAFELAIEAPKQVVYLRFLPAFTDSLVAFGLRNFSREVQARIVEVIRRDYADINLDLRLSVPTDFEDYSLVEIGGPDPNGQDLLGLDNTPGLDDCNNRQDDQLAGRNADSGNLYGGIFVESLLQFSARRSLNPLADPLFDEVFDPLMTEPALPGEEDGPRAAVIQRAIKTLGTLVGTTASHEIGHSLGLSRHGSPEDPYHDSPPAPWQLMDAGMERSFMERAELDPTCEGCYATFSEADHAYLQLILPLD